MPITIEAKKSKIEKDWKSRAGAIRYGSAVTSKARHWQNPKYKEYQQPRSATIIEPASWSKKA